MAARLASRGAFVFSLFTVAALALTASCSTTDEPLLYEEDSDAGSNVVPGTTGADASNATTCGNGVLDVGEGCDDGNTKDGDGCNASCVTESASTNACPGTAITLASPTPTTRAAKIAGDTTGSTPSFDSPSCGGGNGKDVVYALTSDVTGRARITLDAKFDAILYARTSCATATSELSCKGVPVGGGKTELSFPVATGQTTYLFVDGVGGTSGTFELGVEIGVTSCGDGVAQYPEQCDDGNTAPGDGCSAACELETPMSAPGVCPGASFTLGPKTVSFAGDVALLKSTAGAFGCSGGSAGKDQVYAITPTVSGAITAELHASYGDSLLHVRGECFSSATEIDCKEQSLASVPTKITFPVVAQQTYFVFVDSDKSSLASGLYTLDVTLSGPTCGNGILETPEACDDGNLAPGDGCAADCTLEPQPDGIDTCPGATIAFAGPPEGPVTFTTTTSTANLQAKVKSCTGTLDRKDAVYTFIAPFDGYLTAKTSKSSFNTVLDLRSSCVLETTSGSSGSITCSRADGGDGDESIKAPVTSGTAYTLVVEGSTTNTNKEGVFTLDVAITKSFCGNGVIEGGEACDDGANAAGDGCAADCTLEPVPTTRTSCATAEALTLTETTAGSGIYTATATGGNWNLPGGGSMAFPCGNTAGKEAYFTVTPPIDGVVVARTSGNYNISLGARSACPPSTGSGFLTCSNKSGGGDETIAFVATANQTYWIIVDAGTNDKGSFTLDVSVQGESCGDGLVSGAEACDDGNTTAGDGCSPTCTLETLAGADTCPGHAVALTGTGTETRSKVVTLSTETLANDTSGTCGGSGRDGVIAVTSDVGGSMIAELAGTWATVLYARETCSDSSSELSSGCKAYDEKKPSDTLRQLTLTVKPGVPVYFFVDGIGSASGPATLSLTVTP